MIESDPAILGVDTPRVDAHERQLRAEYAWLADFLFNRTRRRIIGEFVARLSLYTTPYATSTRERKRVNLSRSLSRLALRQVCLARRSALARATHFDVNHARQIAMDA